MRLIDADHIEKFIEDGLNNPDKAKSFGHDAIEIMTEVHYADEVDPVHAAGGCYCRECRMRSGIETKETVLCGYHGCSMRKDDFCSMGKREEKKDG